MPAKTGKEYIERLKKANNNVYIDGQRVEDVTEHPAFKNVIRSMAQLYDLQYQKADKMLYTSPTSGAKVGKTFMEPKTIDDLIERREAIMEWQRFSGGLMGRTPDYLNADVMAMGAAHEFFAEDDPLFAENAKKYSEYARENDLSLTHTLIHPQVNRAKAQHEQKDANVALHLVEKTKDGIIVDGIRLLATQGAITDEIIVFPSTVKKSGELDDPYSLAFAIPNNTPGLKFLSRESFDYGKNEYDHPLSSRFEEGDAIVSFENVLVPWDRVFISENSSVCNRAFRETNAVVHMAHQVVAKDIAKTEFILGVVLSVMDAIGIDGFQHVKDKGAEIMMTLETMKSHLFRAEHNAKLDKWGVMTPDYAALDAARNWYPRMYPRLAEIVRILGASGMMGIPTYADYESEEIGSLLNRATQGKNVEGYERVQLFRLAWDLTMSAFGSRQTHYEYYFFGDPIKMGMAYFDGYDKEPYKEMIHEFLGRTPQQRPVFKDLAEEKSIKEERAFRDAMGKFSTGVTVITTTYGKEVHGMTANAFMSVSIHPKLISISVDEKARMHEAIKKTGKFTVNILSEDQLEISKRFAGQIEDKQKMDFDWDLGMPVIRNSLAHVICEVFNSHQEGDHTIYIGKVLKWKMNEGKPLTFFEGKYGLAQEQRVDQIIRR